MEYGISERENTASKNTNEYVWPCLTWAGDDVLGKHGMCDKHATHTRTRTRRYETDGHEYKHHVTAVRVRVCIIAHYTNIVIALRSYMSPNVALH